MELELNLVEEVGTGFSRDFFEGIMHETLAAVAYRTAASFRLSRKKVTLNAVAISRPSIRSLNRRYRGKDAPTDILSFGDEIGAHRDREAETFLGELLFSPVFIRAQAKKDRRPYEQSMIYIFAHGILHLLGHDHTPEMFRIQDEVTEKLYGRNTAQSA